MRGCMIIKKIEINWHDVYVKLGLDMKIYELIKSGKNPTFDPSKTEREKGAS